MFEELPPFMTVVQAGEVLRIGRSKAYELTVEWELSGGRSGLAFVWCEDLYEEAWRRHARAQHHLDHSGIRGRRAARHDHHAAATQLDVATEHLERTRRQTAADVEHYHQARTRADDTSTALHRHDMRQLLNHTVDHVAALRRQVESLDLWGRWAGGDTVNVQQLGDIVEQLTNISHRDEHTDQFQTLGQTVRDWAGDAGIDLPTATRHSRTLQRAGPELGL